MNKKNQLLFFICFWLCWISCSIPQKISDISEDSIGIIIQDYESLDKNLKDHYPSFWPNISKEKLKEELEGLQKIKARVEKIDVTKLSKAAQIDYDLISLVVDNRIYLLNFEAHLFPLNSEGGFLAGIVYDIQNQRISSEEEFNKFEKKLSSLPDYFDERTAQMLLGQQKGLSSPKIIIQNCIKLIDGILNTPVNQLFFLNPVKGHKDRTTKIMTLIDQEILPAYRKFKSFLKNDYLPKAPEKVGITEITNGKKYYEQRTRFFTTFDISPKEVFDIGQNEVKRIRGEMKQIIADLKFDGSFPDFLAFLRTNPQFYPQTPKALLQKAAWITTEMQGKLPDYFGKLPRMPLTVKPVPAALAPNYTGGRYSPGSYEHNKAGQYWVNTYKLESRPYYVLPALSLHEGVPGHHLQIMLAAEIIGLSDFRQSTYLSAFGEGWGLYAEYLGKEAGIYKTPYEDFGRLTYEMWRACRLVVDPGMHYLGWTREKAVDFMTKNTALSLHEINTEIDRYIGWPGQAVSYKIGELKIRALRKFAEESLGNQFNIRNFHDKILQNGSIPLSSLEQIIKEYVEETKKIP